MRIFRRDRADAGNSNNGGALLGDVETPGVFDLAAPLGFALGDARVGEQDAVAKALLEARGKIVVKDIKKGFARGAESLQVIAGISFAVGQGKITALVGPSGCGKSTLMNIIAGFEQPDTGAVFVNGAVRNRPNPGGIVISQRGSVFPWLNVIQNVAFGLKGKNDKEKVGIAERYIALVGLKGFERSYPHELSGGMLKRVEIARALAVRPEILYMDEPFSALDALMSLRMRVELLRILEEDRHTVVLITHDVEEAIHLADQVLVLSARPATVQARFDVPLPHPRKLTSPDAQVLKEAILSELGL